MLNKCAIVFAVYMAIFVGYLNAENFSECVICDSTKEEKCAKDPARVILQKCPPSEVTKCYTRIVDGTTYRGCMVELDADVQRSCFNDSLGVNCTLCENVNNMRGCNNNVFPAHRLRCHSCSGDLKSDCFKAIEGNAPACKIYNDDDKCYTRKTSSSIERGCLTDTSRCANVSHCKICDGDGCNNEDGNTKDIPTAPNSSPMWTATITTIIVSLLLSLKIAS